MAAESMLPRVRGEPTNQGRCKSTLPKPAASTLPKPAASNLVMLSASIHPWPSATWEPSAVAVAMAVAVAVARSGPAEPWIAFVGRRLFPLARGRCRLLVGTCSGAQSSKGCREVMGRCRCGALEPSHLQKSNTNSYVHAMPRARMHQRHAAAVPPPLPVGACIGRGRRTVPAPLPARRSCLQPLVCRLAHPVRRATGSEIRRVAKPRARICAPCQNWTPSPRATRLCRGAAAAATTGWTQPGRAAPPPVRGRVSDTQASRHR
eukprot:266719-Chlamydomonas_euryale.AAC.5